MESIQNHFMHSYRLIYFLFTFILLFSKNIQAQESESFLPKLFYNDDRILVMFSPSPENSKYEKQLQIMLDHKEPLLDRQVALYKIYPREGLNAENERLATANVLKLRQQFKIEDDQFALLFVGVNGEVKFETYEVINIDPLLTVLDTTTYENPTLEKTIKDLDIPLN
ncbi:MAG: DUF4174 domain-containing protein [Candidatus Cyclobacteriaceae bacterium M3_2C_046]